MKILGELLGLSLEVLRAEARRNALHDGKESGNAENQRQDPLEVIDLAFQLVGRNRRGGFVSTTGWNGIGDRDLHPSAWAGTPYHAVVDARVGSVDPWHVGGLVWSRTGRLVGVS